MDVFRVAAQSMRMDEAVWRRHSHPASFWTRVPTGPLLVAALYARVWLGWWCLVPVAVLLAWTWLNPRVFPEPADKTRWPSRAVLGERLFLQRGSRKLPGHHLIAARATSAIALGGTLAAVYGVVALAPWAAGLGAALMALGKLWFTDRMAWLYDDVGDPSASPG